MSNNLVTASILVIGNEILSGRTQDTNVSYIAKSLENVGIKLIEVRMVLDQKDMIVEAINSLRKKYDYLFTTGGIGTTHDDITFACVADAFNRKLVENSKISEILKNYHISTRHALIPEGISGFIENPVSNFPSFYIENVYILAGMPSVMKGMFDGIIPTLKKGIPVQSLSIRCNLLEDYIAQDLEKIQDQYTDIEIGSYPFYNSPDDIGVEFVIKGHYLKRLEEVYEKIQNMITQYPK